MGNTAPFTLGVAAWAEYYFDGLMKDAAIWDVVLAPDQIRALATGSAPLTLSKRWERGFGGTGSDSFSSVVNVQGGGYFVAGESRSLPSGNKTAPYYGVRDYWVVRVDDSGTGQWDRSYGGSAYDRLVGGVEMGTGGFLFVGYGDSSPSGNKSAPLLGGEDAWLVCADAGGTKLFDRAYGGALEDAFITAVRTQDGQYLLMGASGSPPGPAKAASHYGSYDAWLVKVDASGNPLWEKTYGGANADQFASGRLLPDGGFILLGYTQPGVGGNKLTPGVGGYDYYVVRIDAAGNRMWERTLGGSGHDYGNSVIVLPDGAFLLVGTSISPAGGSKTDRGYGGDDWWLVLLDAQGGLVWDRCLGGTENDTAASATLSLDGSTLVVAGSSASGISGNRETALFGPGEGSDGWVVAFQVNGLPDASAQITFPPQTRTVTAGGSAVRPRGR